MGMMLHELNLTDAQKTQVKTIMQKNHTFMKETMQQLEQYHAAMLAVSGANYDANKIGALIQLQIPLQAKMMANHELVVNQIYTQVLTAEQQAKAEQLRTDQINRINQHLQKMANGTDTPPPPAE